MNHSENIQNFRLQIKDIAAKKKREADPLYMSLYNSVLGVTNAMSQNNWDTNLSGTHSDMDGPIDVFVHNLHSIDKEKGREEAQKMLNAVIDKIGKSDFFLSLPDRENKEKQLKRTLNMYFHLAFDTQQNKLH